jgi:Cys-rich four helix bundle protein (predicted Tat secretion target)
MSHNEVLNHPVKSFSRRQLLADSATTLAVAGIAMTGLNSQIANAADSMPMHDMKTMHDKTMMHSGADPKRQAVIDTAMDCVKLGRECAQHCVMMFQMGDQSLKDCYATVQELVVSCNALAELAIQNSAHLREFIQVCTKVCESCETECRKHEKHHQMCKDCADSCKACVKACDDYLA